MLPASMLPDLKHQAYAWYVMVMYLSCDTFMERHFTTLDSTFSKNSLRDPKMCSQTKSRIPKIYARDTIF